MFVASPFVGREPQIEIVERLLDDVVHGAGAALFVTGEPGIGKTRFAEEVLARAESRGARTARATCWRDGGAPPLWSWAELLRELTGAALELEQSAGEGPDAAEAARFLQFEAVTGAMRSAAETAPVVVVLDDLQWADVASLRLLEFAGVALRDQPCLLVGTYRPGELATEEVAALARIGSTLVLGGLDRPAICEVLATAAGASVSDEVADVVEARSDGNPLFVWEFGRLMSATGRYDVAAAAVPPAVAAVIQRRFARLSETVIAYLQAAAVVGKQFSATMVQTIAGGTIDAVSAALEEAVGSGVLVRTPRGETDLAFAHDLIRDVVTDTTPVLRRAELHERAANAYVSRASTDPSLHAMVAVHLEQAGPEARDDAGRHWEEAARWALEMLAYEEAAAHFARALASSPERSRRAELLLAEADARLRAGELAEARARFADAAVAARLAGQPDLFAAAALGIGAGLAGWEVPIWDQAHVDLLEQALVGLGPDSIDLRAMLLARLSVAKAAPESSDTCRQLAEAALALARQVENPRLVAHALASLCDALSAPDHAATRRAHARAIVELAEASGDRALALLGQRFLVVALLELGDFPALDREIGMFERRAGLLHQPLLGWYAPLFRGMRALLRGDIEAAQRFHVEVAAVAARTGSANAGMLAATLGIGIDVALDRPSPIDEFEALTDVDPAVWASLASALGFVAMRSGDRARTQTLLRFHADDGFERVARDSEYLATLTMFGRIAVWLGDGRAMDDLYDRLASYTGMWVVDGIAAHCWGPVDLELARLAAALDRRDEAIAHLDAARAAVASAGARLLGVDIDDLALELSVAGHSRELAASAATGPNVFRDDGDVWTLTYQGRSVLMKASKGLGDIARLLAEPGHEVHVSDLYGDRAPNVVAHRSADLGDVLDAPARAAYRARLVELETELADAEAVSDRGRAEAAADERDFLAAELAAALGLGGKPRKAGDPNERARKAVSTRIRLAIERLAEPHPLLARHLGNSIRTGAFCSYQPEHPTTWTL